jgi:hypothetical protein
MICVDPSERRERAMLRVLIALPTIAGAKEKELGRKRK